MPTPTLFINTSGVSWTPTGGSATALNRITQAGLDWGQETVQNRADLDIFDSAVHVVGMRPTVTFQGMNVMAYLNLTPGLGAITWKIGNADNQSGAGSVIWTMTPCMNQLGSYTGSHGAYATGGLSFIGVSADGLTNPASYTVVSAGSFLPPDAPMFVKNFNPKATVPSFGMPFSPPVKGAPAPDAPPDAVILPLARYAVGTNDFRNSCRLVLDAAKILGLDPDSVSVRSQGANRVVTPSPHWTAYHKKDSDFAGEHRLDWHDRGDGIKVGFLTERAKEADESERDAEV